MNFENIPLGRHAPGVINVVVETPKGSRNKYRYDPKRRRFVVEYKLGIPVPVDYGWVPQTLGVNGEPLEAMVVSRFSTRPGYVCQARPIGALKQKDGEHKLICVMLGDDRYIRVQDIYDLDNKTLKRIVAFFEPFFEFDGWMNKEEAYKLIKEAHERYMESKPKEESDAAGDDKVEREGMDRADRSDAPAE